MIDLNDRSWFEMRFCVHWSVEPITYKGYHCIALETLKRKPQVCSDLTIRLGGFLVTRVLLMTIVSVNLSLTKALWFKLVYQKLISLVEIHCSLGEKRVYRRKLRKEGVFFRR